MKKLILVVLVAGATAIFNPARAQVSLQINLGPRVYSHVDHYYLPVERSRPIMYRKSNHRFHDSHRYQGRKVVVRQSEYRYDKGKFKSKNKYKDNRRGRK